MEKFICEHCGEVFESFELKTIGQSHPYGDTYASEYFSVCPTCECEVDEAVLCDDCGQYVSKTDIATNDLYNVCVYCMGVE